jgi:hypothetical protein
VNSFSAAAKLVAIEIAAATTSATTVAFSNRDAFPVRWSSANSELIEDLCSVACTERSSAGKGRARLGCPLVGRVGSWHECFAGLTGMHVTCAVAFASRRSAGTTTARVSGFSSTIASFIFSLSNSNHGHACLPKFFLMDEKSVSFCPTAGHKQITSRVNAATRIAKLRRRTDIRIYPTATLFVSIVLLREIRLLTRPASLWATIGFPRADLSRQTVARPAHGTFRSKCFWRSPERSGR